MAIAKYTRVEALNIVGVERNRMKRGGNIVVVVVSRSGEAAPMGTRQPGPEAESIRLSDLVPFNK